MLSTLSALISRAGPVDAFIRARLRRDLAWFRLDLAKLGWPAFDMNAILKIYQLYLVKTGQPG